MLFNSYVFMFGFLPIVFIIFSFLKKSNSSYICYWLVLASCVFYLWWEPKLLTLLLASILINYYLGIIINKQSVIFFKKITLAAGILINLFVIGYFKYANFFITNLNVLSDSNSNEINIILPLAISFFTFQQIAYLIDTFNGKTINSNLLEYSLFITFFPQLIAGPIVYHNELVPQFRNFLKSSSYVNFSIGITIFAIGLFKKVVLADSMAIYSNAVFLSAEQGITLTFFEAWGGALAYTFELYFDFSGYTDMAIGLARIFGIILPINFYSPYKASSIIVFWKRWHITLSRFLKEYLYFKLGGDKFGNLRKYLNILIVMAIGGLWHGASWNFIFWGLFHGVLIIINHLSIVFFNFLKISKYIKAMPFKALSILLTFFLIVVSWVIFRAENIHIALEIIRSMFSFDRIILPDSMMQRLNFLETYLLSKGVTVGSPFYNGIADWRDGLLIFGLSFFTIWVLPNTSQIFNHDHLSTNMPKFHQKEFIINVNWKPNLTWALVTAIYLVIGLVMISSTNNFIYFQF